MPRENTASIIHLSNFSKCKWLVVVSLVAREATLRKLGKFAARVGHTKWSSVIGETARLTRIG